MPLLYDQPGKFQWTNRCKEWPVEWGTNGVKTLYPLEKMQVGDYFLVPLEGDRLAKVQQAVGRWTLRWKTKWEEHRPGKPFPEFSCRLSREFPGAYVCRRIK